MKKPSVVETNHRPALAIRRSDQACVGVLLLIGVVGLAGWWWYSGGSRRLVDVDRDVSRMIEFQVDINRASWPELTVLPGIGETLARRIVESREKDGTFRKHDELERVKGIGPKTISRIKPYLSPLAEDDAAAVPAVVSE